MRILNRPLRILLLTDALVLISGAMIVPIYAIFVEKIGGDILDAGIAASLFAAVAGVSSLAAGKFSDKVKRKEHVIAAGYLIMALGFVLYTVIDSVWQLMVVQVMIGLAQASYTPAYDALYTKHLGTERHISSRWSLWESINYLSIAVGALVGAVILHFTNFVFLFIAMAVLCGFSGLYLALLPKRTV